MVTHHILYHTCSLDVWVSSATGLQQRQAPGLKVRLQCCPFVPVSLVGNCFCWIINEIKGLSANADGLSAWWHNPECCVSMHACLRHVCSLDSWEGRWQVSEKSRPMRLWVETRPLSRESQFPPWTFSCTGPELVSLPLVSFGERTRNVNVNGAQHSAKINRVLITKMLLWWKHSEIL